MLLEMPFPVRFGKGHLSPLQEGHISATAGDRSDFMAIVFAMARGETAHYL